ncbi:MAG: Hsp20/alpha crystallin family protein [Candidatus Hodarchaeota archaeon]
MSDVEEKKKVEINEEKQPEENETTRNITLRTNRPLSPYRTIDRLFNEMDRLFADLWHPARFWNFEPLRNRLFEEDPFFRTPLANIEEDDENFNITAELPGLDKGDLKITVKDGFLEIKGEQKEEKEDKNEGFVRREYRSSSYYRSFDLPESVDEDKIDARLDKGILKLTLPKKEEEKKEKKKIEVK